MDLSLEGGADEVALHLRRQRARHLRAGPAAPVHGVLPLDQPRSAAATRHGPRPGHRRAGPWPDTEAGSRSRQHSAQRHDVPRDPADRWSPGRRSAGAPRPARKAVLNTEGAAGEAGLPRSPRSRGAPASRWPGFRYWRRPLAPIAPLTVVGLPTSPRRTLSPMPELHEKLDDIYDDVLAATPARRSSTRRSARCSTPRAGPRQAPGVRRRAVIERLCEPERQIIFRVPWAGRQRRGPRSTAVSASSSTLRSVPTRAACGSTPR